MLDVCKRSFDPRNPVICMFSLHVSQWKYTEKKAIFEIGEERANRAIAELGSWKSFTKLAKGGTVLDFD